MLYGLDDRGGRSSGTDWVKNFFLQVVPTGSRNHQASYPMDIGNFSLSVKRPGREADHSPPTSVEIKKIWIYTSTPHTPSWCSA
jgi:hypothetical protein